MIKLIFISHLFYFSISFASVASGTLEGTVVSFDQKTVILDQGKSKIKVPRQYFQNKDLKTGDKVSTISLNQNQLSEFIPELKQKK